MEAGEECDGSVPDGSSCYDQDLWWGEPVCLAQCTLAYDGCLDHRLFENATG